MTFNTHSMRRRTHLLRIEGIFAEYSNSIIYKILKMNGNFFLSLLQTTTTTKAGQIFGKYHRK